MIELSVLQKKYRCSGTELATLETPKPAHSPRQHYLVLPLSARTLPLNAAMMAVMSAAVFRQAHSGTDTQRRREKLQVSGDYPK